MSAFPDKKQQSITTYLQISYLMKVIETSKATRKGLKANKSHSHSQINKRNGIILFSPVDKS